MTLKVTARLPGSGGYSRYSQFLLVYKGFLLVVGLFSPVSPVSLLASTQVQSRLISHLLLKTAQNCRKPLFLLLLKTVKTGRNRQKRDKKPGTESPSAQGTAGITTNSETGLKTREAFRAPL